MLKGSATSRRDDRTTVFPGPHFPFFSVFETGAPQAPALVPGGGPRSFEYWFENL